MTTINFAGILRPISEASPCGPDLELADDSRYMQFMARAEGLIPASFFSFDRDKIDFEAEFQVIGDLLAETRDLRLLTLLAKLLILNRDLGGFSACCNSMGTLLADLWQHVHPRIDGGDAILRMSVLQTLDDMPAVVFPLQHAPLTQSRRLGPISYRTYLLATGDVKPREGEQTIAPQAVENALLEAEINDIIAARDDLRQLHTALNLIQTTSVQQVGFEEAVRFENLPPLVEKMLTLLDSIVLKRDPAAALPAEAKDSSGSALSPAAPVAVVGNFLNSVSSMRTAPVREQMSGPPRENTAGAPSDTIISTPADAAAALSAAAAYLNYREPSNPAVLLVRQAEQLMGKSFLEVMRILLPAQADQATIHIGTEQVFELPLERLAALIPGIGPDASKHQSQTSDGPGSETAPEPGFIANTRLEAMTLVHHVAKYYRAKEPSSPIPLLADRALALAEQDFLGLLKDVLPDAATTAEATEGS